MVLVFFCGQVTRQHAKHLITLLHVKNELVLRPLFQCILSRITESSERLKLPGLKIHDVVIHILHKQFLKQLAATVFIFKSGHFATALSLSGKRLVQKCDWALQRINSSNPKILFTVTQRLNVSNDLVQRPRSDDFSRTDLHIQDAQFNTQGIS